MSADTSRHDLIPLPLAVRLVYLKAYGSAPPAAHLVDRRNGLAYLLAGLGTIYAIEGAGCAPPRPLSREELSAALFRHGGKELHFLDDRPPITDLCVTGDSIEKTVNALLTAIGRIQESVEAS